MKAGFTIFLACNEPGLASELRERIEAALSVIDVEIAYFDNWKRLCDELRHRRPELFLLSATLSGVELPQVALELRRSAGEAGVIFLGDPGAEAPSGAISFPVPIPNWTRFLESVTSFIPEIVKARAGMQTRQGPLFEAAKGYAARYAAPGARQEEAPLHSIPVWHSSLESAQAPGAAAASPLRAGASSALAPGPRDWRRAFLAELGLLAALAAGTALAFWLDEDAGLLSARALLTVLLLISLGSFFLGRAIERGLRAKRGQPE